MKSTKAPAKAATPAIRNRIKGYREVRAAELKGAPWNWREHPDGQRSAVAASIQELGFFDPLDTRELPDGSLELIDGHLRQEIINADIGPDTLIPVVVTDFTEAEAKKANLIKDPLAAMAETNQANLDVLLSEVSTGSQALEAMLTELAGESGGDEGKLKPLDVRPPPAMTWVLLGIPIVRFGEVAAAVESLAGIDGIICEMTANDG